MIDPALFIALVVNPTLESLGHFNSRLNSPSARQLLLGIALQESGLKAIEQHGGGPALGPYQMEPGTHYWLTAKYLEPREDLRIAIFAAAGEHLFHPVLLATNWRYATALARVNLWRDPKPLPRAGDTEGQAAYWKRVWNTNEGAGTVEQYLANWWHHAPKDV